jgi:arabinose-5-phosphate isomerase
MKNFEKIALDVIENELKGLELLKSSMPADFEAAATAISKMKGRLIVSGIGKSGYIGQKISASFSSTGTRSFYIHPAEASHGDLGMIGDEDIVLLLSNSGETKELLDIISYCKRFSIAIIGITMQTDSVLARSSNYILNIPVAEEASSVNAPTTSSTMMLALGDALVVSVHEHKGFSKEDFAVYHPGGKLGASLLKVSSIMHVGDQVPSVKLATKMSDVLFEMTGKGFGCSAVIDDNNKIIGIVTDGDLRRHMSSSLMDDIVDNVMTKSPITIGIEKFAVEVLAVMNKKNITSLLVENDGELAGIVHVHDLLRAGVK